LWGGALGGRPSLIELRRRLEMSWDQWTLDWIAEDVGSIPDSTKREAGRNGCRIEVDSEINEVAIAAVSEDVS
jgi:hypothetical protein